MITFVAYIITMILALNRLTGWAIAFFIIGTLALPIGGEE